MSNLTIGQQSLVSKLFDLTSGYPSVYQQHIFPTRRKFKEFMAIETDIDVYKDITYQSESSMGKKFSLFMEKENDAIVGKTILALLRERDTIIREKIQFAESELDEEFVDDYAEEAEQIRCFAERMAGNINFQLNNQQRIDTEITEARQVLSDLIGIAEIIIPTEVISEKSSEDQINDEFRNSFILKGYQQVKDQTRHGIASGGKKAGEVDLLIEINNKEKALIEGLKLTAVDKNYITQHIDKAITNYNALGTPTFILAYVSTANFLSFWNRYLEFIQEFHFACPRERDISELSAPNAATKVAETVLNKDGYSFPVYFVCLNIKK